MSTSDPILLLANLSSPTVVFCVMQIVLCDLMLLVDMLCNERRGMHWFGAAVLEKTTESSFVLERCRQCLSTVWSNVIVGQVKPFKQWYVLE